jgi:spectinomycin phosphotransferase
VVCHADLHTGNVLVDERGELHLIDWDEVVLAPRERDLMFVVDGGISRDLAPLRGERAFLAGYGDVDVHRPTLAYYKFAWAVQDISEYATQAFTRHELSPETRAAALDILRTLFATGEIVERARAADV